MGINKFHKSSLIPNKFPQNPQKYILFMKMGMKRKKIPLHHSIYFSSSHANQLFSLSFSILLSKEPNTQQISDQRTKTVNISVYIRLSMYSDNKKSLET